MSIIQRLERLEQARQTQRIAAFDRLLGLLTPEETMALEATLEADLTGQLVPPDIEQQADVAFARVWAEATPEDQSVLTSGTIAEAW